MSTTTQKIIPDGKHQHLIDLNKDAVNFICKFVITPHVMDLEDEYQASIVTQKQLDNDEDVDFKPLKGIFSGDVKIESNEYQNYFLVIKSSSPMREMSVETTLIPLPVYKNPELQVIAEEPRVEPPGPQIVENYEGDNDNFRFRVIIAFFVIIAGGYLLYRFKTSSKSKQV